MLKSFRSFKAANLCRHSNGCLLKQSIIYSVFHETSALLFDSLKPVLQDLSALPGTDLCVL